MHMRVWKDDKVRWELWARRVEISGDKDFYTITDVHKGLLFRDDKIYHFTAKKATYDYKNKKVHIFGRINFQTEKGDEFFRSRDAFWDGNQEILRLPNRVVVMEDNNLYTGESFEASGEELENFTIIGNVTVIIPDIKKSKDQDVIADLEEAEIAPEEVTNLVLKAQRVEYNGPAEITKAYPTRTWTPMAAPPPPSTLIPSIEHIGALPPPIHMPPTLDLPPDLTLPPGFAPAPGLAPTPESPLLTVSLSTDAWDITAREIYVRGKDKLARAVGSARLLRKGRKPDSEDRQIVKALKKRNALFVTEELRYFWDLGRVEIDNPLTVQQQELTIAANSALILTKQNRAELRGGVTLHQTSGEWLFREKIIEADADEKTKEIARAETNMFASAMDLDFDNEDILATGNVSVSQPDRFLNAGTAVYTGATKIWELYGSVTVRDKQDYYEAPMFTYNEQTGEVLAPQGAYFELLPDDDQRRDFRDYFEDRDKDDFDEQKFNQQKIFVRGGHMRFDDDKDILTITGDADVKFKDVSLTGDLVTIYMADETAHAEGTVKIKDKYTTLTGAWASANWNTEDYQAGGGVRVTHTGNAKKDSDPFELKGKELKWNKKTGAGSVTGDPVLTSRSRRVTARTIDFNSEDKIYMLEGSVSLEQENGDWLRGKDYIDANDDQAWALAKKPTHATCNSARFEPDNDYFLLLGEVHVTQPQKEVFADRIEYWGKKKRLLLDGNVHMAQSRGEWLFEGGFVDETDDEEIKKRARKPADIYCARLESLYGERKLHLSGGVRIEQGKSQAAGDTVWHYGKTKQTIIEGNVRVVDEDGTELKSKRVLYNGNTKVLEAFNAITGSGFMEEDKNKKR
jgi:lipopolysaccharide assembly outer membrane protein LptD (OstA)